LIDEERDLGEWEIVYSVGLKRWDCWGRDGDD
jgi:hypothetical protein